MRQVEPMYIEGNLPPLEIAQIFPLTFYFSQGLPPMQLNIDIYIAAAYRGCHVIESDGSIILGLTAPDMLQHVYNEGKHEDDVSRAAFAHELKSRLRQLIDTINNIDGIRADLSAILQDMIESDNRYIIGRPRVRVEKRQTSPAHDMYISHLIHYLFHFGDPQRVYGSGRSWLEYKNLPPVFKKLICDLRMELKHIYVNGSDSGIIDNVKKIIRAYNKSHPNWQVSITDINSWHEES